MANNLTNATCQAAKAADKDYKLPDGGGMFLLVKTNGGKYWRLKYRFNGKEKLLAIGVYPTVSLSEARKAREAAKALLAQDIDPGEAKKEKKRLTILEAENTFDAIANEWLSKKTNITTGTAKSYRHYLAYAVEFFGNKPITTIYSPDVLAVCRQLEAKGTIETAHRVKMTCGLVFRYAVATGRATNDPTHALRGALQPVITKHHAAIIDPSKIASLMQDIAGYEGNYATAFALRLAPLVFVRPGELRTAQWKDIDLEAKEWTYYVSKTKTDSFIVPLSSQAVAILTELKTLTGNSLYLFPSIRTNSRPMSNNTINAALRRLGYASDEMCGHGFRAMARTILEERLGYRIEVIEMQLAHAVKDPNGRAYNRTKLLDERHKMMQHWADYLDGLQGGNVVSVRFGAA